MLTLILLVSTLAACSSPDPSSFEARKRDIEKAWLAEKGSAVIWDSDDNADSWTYGVRYYGTYNGYDILFCPKRGVVPCEPVYIPGASISCHVAFDIYAYRDGVFLPLLDAYQDDLISVDDARQIRDAHIARNREALLLDMKDCGVPAISEEKMLELDDAFYAQEGYRFNWCNPAAKDHTSDRYYGTHGGYGILFTSSIGPLEMISTVTIGDYSFKHAMQFELYAHRDGEFRPLKEIYDDGLISDQSIAEIYEAHRDYCLKIAGDNDYFRKVVGIAE